MTSTLDNNFLHWYSTVMRLIDMTGKTYGKLTALGCVGVNRKGEKLWHFQCVCGAQPTIAGYQVRSGHTKSCGCGEHVARDVDERFWEKVRKTDECWYWVGNTLPTGYGLFPVPSGLGGKHRTKQLLAHRYAYERLVGPISKGLYLLHSCDNPACVNPSHLRPGTQKDNIQDAASRQRMRRGGVHPHAKLTESDVVEIKCRLATRVWTYADIASMYGVSSGTISSIARGINWGWLKVIFRYKLRGMRNLGFSSQVWRSKN